MRIPTPSGHFYSVGNWNPAEFGRPVFLGWRLSGSTPSRRSMHDGAFSGPGSFEPDFAFADSGNDAVRGGPSWLSNPSVAAMIAETLATNADTLGHFTLHAWAVLPNHLDLLITPVFPLAAVSRQLRQATARRADLLLGLAGQTFWHESAVEYPLAGDLEFGQTWMYIESEPVRAGLARRPCDYPWSSATATSAPRYSEPAAFERNAALWL